MRHVQRSDVTIRPAVDADRPRLFEIWRAAVSATHGFLSPEHDREIEAMVREHYFPAADFIVAADEHDRAIGFLERDDATTIGALFVHPALHGQGIGRALLATMPQNQPLTVEVNEANAAARAVYEHWGFVTVGRKPTDGDGRPYPLLVMRRAPFTA